MLLLLSLTEDSLISLFVRRQLTYLEDYESYYLASTSLPKGYLFPRFYLFYDDAHFLPVPYFRYQYLDTVHLRLEEREMDLGLPDIRRMGWGFAWSVLDPQVLALTFAAREANAYAHSALSSARENAITNFRLLLRGLHLVRTALSVLDSALSGADSLLSTADTLQTLGRLPPEAGMELRMKVLKLRRMREKVRREYEALRDTVEALVGVEVEDVSPSGPLPDCVPYDSTHLYGAQKWRYRAELARFLPKVFAFGEVWYGSPVGLKRDSSGIGTLYGIRITWTFDETGRLRVMRERRLLNLLKREEGRRKGKVREVPDTTLIGEARAVYEEAQRLYRLGRMDAFTLFRIRMEYYELRLEVLKEEIERLRGKVCPVILPEVPPQYTPSP